MNVRRSHLEVIKTKQLEFYRHIQRGRLPKKIMEWQSKDQRKKHRSNLTQMNGIKRVVIQKVLTKEDWEKRDNWRTSEFDINIIHYSSS